MKIFILIFFFMSCAFNNPENPCTIGYYQLSEKAHKTFKLPKKLQEISGLAMSSDGRLFAHNDERAEIHQIDYTSGKIIKSFSIGKKTLKGDFEGLAIAGDIFYLVSSNGVLFKFKEGDQGEHVDYKKYKTHLGLKNDVEGLCFNPSTSSLLLACKGDPGKGYSGYKTIYSFDISRKKLSQEPIFKISIAEISEKIEKNFSQKLADFFQISKSTFAPSGIEIFPDGNSFFILSAQGRLLIEVSNEGKIIGLASLNKKDHPQPEGIAFSSGKDLIITDEGRDTKGRMSIYEYAPKK